MANNTEATQVMSLPLPPAQYINLYTDENIRKNRAPKPPPPILDTYQMFGSTFNNEEMIRSLESQGIRRLIPQHFDRRKELKKLNHSLFANFLDLIDLLIKYPDSPKRIEKIEDLSLLFVHIHHLLNEFRPHQARETLRVLMEVQKRTRIETAMRFQKHLEKVRDLVRAAFAQLPDITDADHKMDEDVGGLGENSMVNGNDAISEQCHPLDRLMCQIIDNMWITNCYIFIHQLEF